MIYSQTNTVRFTEVDARSRLTPVALYNLFQEAAVCHGDAVELTGGELKRRGFAWILNRIRIDIIRYPLRRESVTVETWGSTLQGLYAIREWSATDGDGIRIAAGTSRWILFDIQRRKPVKLPGLIAEGYGVHPQRAIGDPFDRVAPIEDGQVIRRFHVRASELDANQHANSACYVDWCIEGAPNELVLEGTLERIDITYKKESRFGDQLAVETKQSLDSADGCRNFDHVIRITDSNHVAAFGRTVWKS